MPFRRTSIDSNQRTGFYSPKRSRVVGSRVVGYDSDALVYINAVEVADGQALEGSVKDAYNTFVVGCKSDGVWSAIKASCIMAGARTLSGALVPLVGVAPSGFNLASGTYSRVTGLKGDRAAMYLSTNRASSADPQNNLHFSVYLTSAGTSTVDRTHIATRYSGVANSDFSDIFSSSINQLLMRSRNANGTLNSNTFSSPAGSTVGLLATTRSASGSFTLRYNSQSVLVSGAPENISYSPLANSNFALYARPQTPPILYSDARIAFYSIGESLDLALLDARVDRLINDIAFFINTGLSPTAYDIDTLKYVNRGYAAGGSLS